MCVLPFIDGRENPSTANASDVLIAALAGAANGEREEAHAEDHEPGHVPAQILGEAVVDDSEPREHLAEQPSVQTVGNARGRATTLRPAAVVEAHVDHLDERVDPRQDAHAAQLSHEE